MLRNAKIKLKKVRDYQRTVHTQKRHRLIQNIPPTHHINLIDICEIKSHVRIRGGSRVLQLLHMQQSEFAEKIVIKLKF